jgi:dethiobiotin synthetase
VTRPTRLVFVAGTGTEVGKTWVGAALLTGLRERHVRVAARKPVQSFVPEAGPTDADVLGAATGEGATTVCPAHRWFGIALAPPMAAEVLAAPPFTIADLAAELEWPAGVDLGLVEGVGGVRSPLAVDGDTRDLIDALAPDAVILVADAGLGTINAVRLSTAALGDHPLVVALNRFDPGDDLHRRNRDWLSGRCGLDVAETPTALVERFVALTRT